MLIVALVLAVIGLAALVTAVVTSNELIAWVCIAASVIGVVLLIVDAVRERSGRKAETSDEAHTEAEPEYYEDYPEDQTVAEQQPEYADADEETTVVEQADSGEDRR
ncbi:hypothetical protein [Mycobacterium sp. 1164985.4]|uniref:hypothetical protein n=1 Tax=Mycobacterium sp. 1164985.4 TaxID=1834069 RepID=UPI0007FEFBE9|nr:hypothetical protein [Mycobacterium sp. 1164985.4]OBK78413.1 hypothetical protein A5650_11270 [Mycobacterium sp. 1164985.4]